MIVTRRQALAGLAALTTQDIQALAPMGGCTAVPLPAFLAGYKTRTFGPSPVLNTAFYPFNFFSASGAGAVQNPDGSLLLTGVSTSYNGSVCSAHQDNSKPNKWAGIAFGGGAYFEACFTFTPVAGSLSAWPAWWLMDIEHLCGVGLDQWPGEPTGYSDWQEFDIFEFDAGNISKYGIAAHNWYNQPNHLNVSTSFGAITLSDGTFAQQQKYGLLWIPATATSQGSATWYLNGASVGQVTWDQYNAAAGPPPVAGSSAYSIADVKHFCPILGTSNTSIPMTVYSCSVWQSTTANNLQQ